MKLEETVDKDFCVWKDLAKTDPALEKTPCQMCNGYNTNCVLEAYTPRKYFDEIKTKEI